MKLFEDSGYGEYEVAERGVIRRETGHGFPLSTVCPSDSGPHHVHLRHIIPTLYYFLRVVVVPQKAIIGIPLDLWWLVVRCFVCSHRFHTHLQLQSSLSFYCVYSCDPLV